jgi:hypothetical protein
MNGMKTSITTLCAAVVICSAGHASANVLLYDEATKTANQVDARATIGRHFWTRLHDDLTPCSWYACPSSYVGGIAIEGDDGVTIEPGTGFTVISIASGHYGIGEFAQVRLDDGRVGFLHDLSWTTEDPALKKAERQAKAERERAQSDADLKKRFAEWRAADARADRCVAGLDKLHVGMTEVETRPIISCVPLPKVNTTETASGLHKQVVLYMGESSVAGYLYFENGRIVAIQRSN